MIEFSSATRGHSKHSESEFTLKNAMHLFDLFSDFLRKLHTLASEHYVKNALLPFSMMELIFLLFFIKVMHVMPDLVYESSYFK